MGQGGGGTRRLSYNLEHRAIDVSAAISRHAIEIASGIEDDASKRRVSIRVVETM